ncbi:MULTISPECIES: alpha/beta hydrolase [Actinomadura]|uniref:Alpha/beta hydrolase n=1 Tax=Actinomadura yumaensis TaxID=111807 RepID=A0ABW2CGP4_9ACTN|nr:alpha/beta hydrolase [Actinomadura sp. J1-007]
MAGAALAVGAACAIAGTSLAVLSGPAFGTTPTFTPASKGIVWKACANGAECASLRLPVDWARPNGPKFGLALARRKAADPNARAGTMVFGPGGPGDSGVVRVIDGISRFSPEVRRRFDIVSFDPRGVGLSNPVTCSSALLARRPSPLMKSQADFNATLAYNQRLRDDCRARTGPLFDHADTLSMVHDLDAIRAALGDGRLTYHGSSYGTLLGEQYAETYPQRVRAMVLESVVDHSVRGARRFLELQGIAAQDAFDQFVAWCGRTEGCALHGREVRALFADLRAQAERGELLDNKNPGAKLPAVPLVHRVWKNLYGPEWAETANDLAALEKLNSPRAPSGTTPAHGLPQPPASGNATTTPAPVQGKAAKTEADPFAAIFCSDWGLPARDYREYASLTRTMAKVAPDLPYTRPLLAVAGCLGTPRPVSNPQHRLKVRGSAPILLTNGLHDPASGYAWATNVTRQLGRTGTLLTYAGSGHGSTFRGPCMVNATDRYLLTLTLPPRGARCPAVDE